MHHEGFTGCQECPLIARTTSPWFASTASSGFPLVFHETKTTEVTTMTRWKVRCLLEVEQLSIGRQTTKLMAFASHFALSRHRKGAHTDRVKKC